MAHELWSQDSMFSVGKAPWHGLGITLDNPPTIIEGLEKAKLNWEVQLLPLFCQPPKIAGGYQEVSERAVMREDTSEILGVVGANYVPLQNKDAFSIFQPLVESKEIFLETAGSLKNGRRVWILSRINSPGAEIGKGDEIKPYILLSNAHDGTAAVRFGFTPVRVVCNNTLSMAEMGHKSKLVRLIHTSNMYENLEGLRNMINLSKATFTATIEQYRWLANKDINQADLEKYVKIVLDPEIEKAIASAQLKGEAFEMIMTPTSNKIINLFENGIGSDLPKARTWWGAYNCINEWLMYHRGRNADNRLNSVWFADGYDINKTALNTAMKMAA